VEFARSVFYRFGCSRRRLSGTGPAAAMESQPS